MSRNIFLLLTLLCGCFLGCLQKEQSIVTIDPAKTAAPTVQVLSVHNPNTLRVALTSVITPRAGYSYYKMLVEYLGEKLGREISLLTREKYAELNALLNAEKIDLAFICGQPYVDAHDATGVQLLVVPQVRGFARYQSYLIVPTDSPAKGFADLRGKSFAFTDPDSNSGWLVPTVELARMKLRPESFFSNITYTYAHDLSIKAVAQKLVDSATVDSLIWDYLHTTEPEVTGNTKIIWKSPRYGIPPVVVPKGLDPKLKEELQHFFLNLHMDVRGRAILKGMMIEKFVLEKDSAYDSIRAMKKFLREQN
ncbi:MAG: hypothetical protein A2X86_00780 [Bdellovibrionales bacterium GWA2_49_15]|nr:MAG: hypothetical protein A2X86_00780 [Bdellovibrionales bacterium GWA2_49_15]